MGNLLLLTLLVGDHLLLEVFALVLCIALHTEGAHCICPVVGHSLLLVYPLVVNRSSWSNHDRILHSSLGCIRAIGSILLEPEVLLSSACDEVVLLDVETLEELLFFHHLLFSHLLRIYQYFWGLDIYHCLLFFHIWLHDDLLAALGCTHL